MIQLIEPDDKNLKDYTDLIQRAIDEVGNNGGELSMSGQVTIDYDISIYGVTYILN